MYRPSRISFALFFIVISSLYVFIYNYSLSDRSDLSENEPLIIIITPTYRRPERLAELTRFSQTLRHVKNLHWLVIEDGFSRVAAVERLLYRSKISHTYLCKPWEEGMPVRGWTQRNYALSYIREIFPSSANAVVYFADDDNSYDIRLFNNYIRRVKRFGVWAVGLVGDSFVEAPRVKFGKVVGWDTSFLANRTFALDIAGFAINLKEIQRSTATFNKICAKSSYFGPESCFLEQFGISLNDLEPFGHDDDPKDILVWHTKTMKPVVEGGTHGYVVELDGPVKRIVKRRILRLSSFLKKFTSQRVMVTKKRMKA